MMRSYVSAVWSDEGRHFGALERQKQRLEEREMDGHEGTWTWKVSQRPFHTARVWCVVYSPREKKHSLWGEIHYPQTIQKGATALGSLCRCSRSIFSCSITGTVQKYKACSFNQTEHKQGRPLKFRLCEYKGIFLTFFEKKFIHSVAQSWINATSKGWFI